jgi:hypothetical protein
MPSKHPTEVKQPLSKPSPMCKSITRPSPMCNPSQTIQGLEHTPCTPNLMKHPQTWCKHFRSNPKANTPSLQGKCLHQHLSTPFATPPKVATYKYVPIVVSESTTVTCKETCHPCYHNILNPPKNTDHL